MAISNKISGIFSGFSFTNNIGKMRKALMDYFKEEGITCEIKDGALLFEYEEDWYVVNFIAGEDYAECGLVFSIEDENYAALETSDKTFIAAKVNNEVDNHATVQVYNERIKICSTFYFTSEKMMMQLFFKHFNELRECVGAALKLTVECINDVQEEAEEKTEKPQQIGFCVQNDSANESGDKISAKNK